MLACQLTPPRRLRRSPAGCRSPFRWAAAGGGARTRRAPGRVARSLGPSGQDDAPRLGAGRDGRPGQNRRWRSRSPNPRGLENGGHRTRNSSTPPNLPRETPHDQHQHGQAPEPANDLPYRTPTLHAPCRMDRDRKLLEAGSGCRLSDSVKFRQSNRRPTMRRPCAPANRALASSAHLGSGATRSRAGAVQPYPTTCSSSTV
jgi:hypothetical protein